MQNENEFDDLDADFAEINEINAEIQKQCDELDADITILEQVNAKYAKVQELENQLKQKPANSKAIKKQIKELSKKINKIIAEIK